MVETNNKSTVLIIAITIMVIIFGVLGASYAFHAHRIWKNNTIINTSIKSNTVSNLVFTKGSNFNISATTSNFGQGSGNQVSSSTSTVKLTANNVEAATHKYRATVYISENTFVYTNGSTPELKLTVTKNGTTLVNNMDITTTTGAILIPTTAGGSTYKHTITANAGANTTDTWVATITLVNLNTNQAANGNKSIDALFYLDEAPVLPSTYQEVEYIESSGVQQMTYPIFDDFVIYDEVQFNHADNRQLLTFTAGTGASLFWGANTDDNYEVASSASYTMPISSLNRNLVKLTRSNNILQMYVNNRTLTRTGSTSITNYTYYPFGYGSYKASVKRYGLKLFTSDGELKGTLIPCYRVSDNKIGMYDTVNGVFYMNTATGDDFTKGNNFS